MIIQAIQEKGGLVGNYKTDSDDNGETTVIQNSMHWSSISNSDFIILHLIIMHLRCQGGGEEVEAQTAPKQSMAVGAFL